jgi:maltooligosyltrehalose trehalohydrolase
VIVDGRAPAALRAEGNGYFEGLIADAAAGDRYRFSLDGQPPLADPASRLQPEGPHGPSVVVDPSRFAWTDEAWSGIRRSALVVYEMHIGTFTRDGTWAAATRELPALAELGVTCLEILPVADFAGTFGWGYDGVCLYAPTRLYGAPDDFRAFVDAAHRLRLAVILDVVYNHFGPDGCGLTSFSPHYLGTAPTEWGVTINFDGAHADGVREFFIGNAAYWIGEFHLDGLRLDATQTIRDSREPHILAEIAAAAAKQAAGPRATWLVAENEPQHVRLVQTVDEGGFGLDALWNDDFHHSAMVAATGRREAYYRDYCGTPQELISAAKYGFLYQGQWYAWQDQPRGTPTFGLPADAFVAFLQNHDQVANSSDGRRLHQMTSPGKLRTLTALLLLGPWIPMLFQGQEFGADAPFLYFADHGGSLGDGVRRGRRDFLSQFPSTADAARAGALADPCDRRTFEICKLDRGDGVDRSTMRNLHASLLQLRTSEAAFRLHDRRDVDGAVLGPHALVLRFFARNAGGGPAHDEDRLLIVNLGPQLDMPVVPEPLLAPPAERRWAMMWSSDDPMYGGPGISAALRPGAWSLPPECAIVLAPRRPAWRP